MRTSRSASTSPVPPHASARADVADATERTHRWADRCLAAHGRPDQALFGIIQGGLEADLRMASTAFFASRPFDGLCIGGLAGDETPEQRRAVLDVVVPMLADDPRPRYLMGLGSPMDLLDAVDAGVDMFDSVLPARVARNATLWVPDGKLNLRNARFLDDPRPVQDGCRCRLCRSFSRAYLAHLFRANELLAYRLATCHNLTFTPRLHGADPTGDRRRDVPPAQPRSAGSGCQSYPDRRGRIVTTKVARMPVKMRSMPGEVRVKSRRPDWATPCGGARSHGRQSSLPPRNQEEAEGREPQAQARVAARIRRRSPWSCIKPKRKPRTEKAEDAEE